VGEEGLGSLRGIRALVDEVGPRLTEAISVDGALGGIVTKAIAVRRHRITVRGPGGHSWAHYGRPSANDGLVHIADRIAAVRPPERPRTTLNIGVISGGSSVNAIAAEASLELDLRSETPDALAALESEALASVGDVAEGLVCEVQLIDDRPSGDCPEGCGLVRDAVRVLRTLGVAPRERAGSTEANAPLSRGVPAIAFGASRTHGAHSPSECVEVDSLGVGTAALFGLLVLRAAAEAGEG
jgi:di/tripeptidase